MSDCRDCIHYDVCEDNLKYIQERFLKGLTFEKSEFTDGEFCNLFKDKSRIIELPCKVGGKVYQVIPKCNVPYYKCAFNGGIGTDRCEDCNAFIREKKFEYCDIKNINITIFTDKSKAEAKLKELNKNE